MLTVAALLGKLWFIPMLTLLCNVLQIIAPANGQHYILGHGNQGASKTSECTPTPYNPNFNTVSKSLTMTFDVMLKLINQLIILLLIILLLG